MHWGLGSPCWALSQGGLAAPQPCQLRVCGCCGDTVFCRAGSALDLHLSDVSLASLDKELEEQDGGDPGPSGEGADTGPPAVLLLSRLLKWSWGRRVPGPLPLQPV